MIAQISGTLLEKSPLIALIDVQGIGYEISIPFSTCENLGDIGSKANLFTYLHVREDALQLFGFATQAEKQLFVHLISVNGVGPKMAQKILSGCQVRDFCHNIAQKDITALTKIPGIGKRGAENLVYELHEKLSKFVSTDGELVNADNTKTDDAIIVLVSLGYNKTTAKSAVEKAIKTDGDLSIEEIIKVSLKYV